MTVILVRERQYSPSGKPIVEIKKDLNGVPRASTKFDDYYMDLSSEEERKLRETGRFGFESVPTFDLADIPREKLSKGARRKKEVLKD